MTDLRETSLSQQVHSPSTRGVTLFFALAAVESLGGAGMLLSIPADPKHAVFLGFSIFRWTGTLIFGTLLLGSALLAGKAFRGKSFPRIQLFLGNLRSVKAVMGAACAVAWICGSAVFLPGYRVGVYAAWLIRLRPFLLWLFLVSLQTFFGVAAGIFPMPQGSLKQRLQKFLPELRPAALTLCVLGVVWAFIAFTKIGLEPDEMFWNESAPPLLLWQVFGSIAIGLLFFLLERRLRSTHSNNLFAREHRLDLAVCLILWVVAVLAWNLVPRQDSYFAPGPYPPNQEYYPYSDARVYDLSAELAVTGQGLSGQEYVDKPFYSWLLYVLHRLTGNDFSLYMEFYTALMAAFVPIVYLIGRTLKSRPVGIAAAVLVLLYEINAIAATPWINAPNARLLLTEPACRLGLAVFTLWLLRAHQSNSRKNTYLAAAGGALGLTTMIRYNVWFVVPVALFWILLKIKRDWKQTVWSLVVFLSAFLLPLLPWMINTGRTWVTPYFFLTRFRGTVWMQRYAPYVSEPEVQSEFFPSPTQQAVPETTFLDIPFSPALTPEPAANLPASSSTPQYEHPLGAVLSLTSRHFFHNLATSMLALPDSPVLNDIAHIIKAPDSHWLPEWDQTLNFRQIIFLAANLVLLSAGIGYAFRKQGFVGILPLVIYLGYNLGSAFARTSGGRYLAPIEWILILYYLLGWFQVVQFGWQSIHGDVESTSEVPASGGLPAQEWKKIAVVLAAVLLVGLGIPLLDRILPAQYLPDETANLETLLKGNFPAERIPRIQAALDKFLEDEDAVILSGKGLYPRYYQSGEGEAGDQGYTREMAYSRLTFTLLRTGGSRGVILPLSEMPKTFPHGSIVTVVGCNGSGYLDALFVIVETEKGTSFYRRPDINGLKCPLNSQ